MSSWSKSTTRRTCAVDSFMLRTPRPSSKPTRRQACAAGASLVDAEIEATVEAEIEATRLAREEIEVQRTKLQVQLQGELERMEHHRRALQAYATEPAATAPIPAEATDREEATTSASLLSAEPTEGEPAWLQNAATQLQRPPPGDDADAPPRPSLAPAARLRALIGAARAQRRCITLPAAHDAISAALVQRAGFKVAYMSGFALSAAQLALPDAGLASYGEVLHAGRAIVEAAPHVIWIGDGDTGFGGGGNLRRTVQGFARAGFAAISIEDQTFPKRCGFAQGLGVVPRAAAVARLRAALAARDELRAATGLDLLVVGRTDARNAAAGGGGGGEGGGGDGGGLDEAIARCVAFERLGADVVYAEGLRSTEEMARLHAEVAAAPTMLAQVERTDAPPIGAAAAAALGFALSLHGLTLFNASVCAMRAALRGMAAGEPMVAARPSAAAAEGEEGEEPCVALNRDTGEFVPLREAVSSGNSQGIHLMDLAELHEVVGFPEHYQWERQHPKVV